MAVNFPVDGRLESSQEMGVTEFVKKTDIKALVAMHRVDYPAWIPSHKFQTETRPLPIWFLTTTSLKIKLLRRF